MTLQEAIEWVIENKVGVGAMRALCKDDIRFHVYDLTGHYPKRSEFDRIFHDLRVPVNKYNLIYIGSVGWCKAPGQTSINHYKNRLKGQQNRIQQNIDSFNLQVNK